MGTVALNNTIDRIYMNRVYSHMRSNRQYIVVPGNLHIYFRQLV